VDGEIGNGLHLRGYGSSKGVDKPTYKDRVAKYGPIWEITDNKWNNQLQHPIHAIGIP
jgi:hypothetical protein